MTNELQKQEFLKAYDEYADAIFKHCYFRVSSRTKAEDLTQETFMKAWHYFVEGSQIENVKALLYRIATNLIIDEYRRKKEESLEGLMTHADAFDPPAINGENPEQNLLLRQVRDVLDTLDKDEQEILTLRYFDDLGPKDIAKILSVSPNTVSVRLNRAVKVLKRRFAERTTRDPVPSRI